ncbi:putative mitochondrial protein, partial [Mucuna pruriens]
MTALGYKQSQGDYTLFIKHLTSGGVTVLLVYVDDIIVIGDDWKEQQVLIQYLAKEFEIKTLGRLKYHSKKGMFAQGDSQFMHCLREVYLQYLKGTPKRETLYKRNGNAILEAYIDSDYAGLLIDRRSNTGYCTFLGGNLVTWRSKNKMLWLNLVLKLSFEL